MPSIILFVVWAGTSKLKIVFRNGKKIYQKVQNVLYLWFFWALPWQRLYRINEILVLVFNRGDIWLFTYRTHGLSVTSI